MYKFQDYYGEIDTGVECDPYYEDCTSAVIDQTVSTSQGVFGDVPPLVLAFGMVPVLDLTTGLWNRNDWTEGELEEWTTAYSWQIMFGLIELGAWSSAVFLKGNFAEYLPYTSKATVLLEAI